jgi:NAD(P)-dependent dehydrogenase (short-subunit alcohol dehydrogenase family)
MTKPVCAVVGVGPGNGTAFAQKFADEGYAVALCSRDEARLKDYAASIPGSRFYAYDATDPDAPSSVFSAIETDLGPIDVVLYNAGSGVWGTVDEVSAEDFQRAWEINTRGLFLATQAVLPQMRSNGGGSIIVIGATASVRGGAKAIAFASAKGSQRILAQSLARHLGPEKIHVACVILDGMIGLDTTKARMPDKPDDFFLSAEEIAQSVFFLANQPPQAWSFELDLRPYGESW